MSLAEEPFTNLSGYTFIGMPQCTWGFSFMETAAAPGRFPSPMVIFIPPPPDTLPAFLPSSFSFFLSSQRLLDGPLIVPASLVRFLLESTDCLSSGGAVFGGLGFVGGRIWLGRGGGGGLAPKGMGGGGGRNPKGGAA